MDYYQILGVSRDSSDAEIKKAYRKLSKENHPDKHKGDKEKEEKYKQINRAYEALSDPKKKQAYDQFGNEDGPQYGGGGFGGGQGFEGFGDIFETFFGGGGGGVRRRQADTSGRDVQVRIVITMEESFTGSKKTVRIKKNITCTGCFGSGEKKGSKKVTCSTCGGTGQVTRTAQSFFGMIQQSAMCDECNGAGKIPEKPCEECRGAGRTMGQEETTIEIPAGIHDGQTLRLREKGEAGTQGGVHGDLYVLVQVKPDHRFSRDGDDLRLEVSVPVADATLGTEVAVETFKGTVKLKVPAGTQPLQILRLKGKGMPILSSARHGDLFVTVRVEVPKKLGKKERKLWEDLR
jgi:molecular chaperone DnaJ